MEQHDEEFWDGSERRSGRLSKAFRNSLQIAGIVAVAFSCISWVFGPVLGKEVIGDSQRIERNTGRVNELYRLDSLKADSLARLSRRLDRLEHTMAESIFIQCEVLKRVAPNSILPSSCPKDSRSNQ